MLEMLLEKSAAPLLKGAYQQWYIVDTKTTCVFIYSDWPRKMEDSHRRRILDPLKNVRAMEIFSGYTLFICIFLIPPTINL